MTCFRVLPTIGLTLLTATTAVQAQIVYDVSFPNAVHHEAEVTVTFTDLPPGALEVRMSRSSPGRYAIHEFAKNMYNVRAVDGQGRPLEITRPNPYQWNVSGHDGTVTVSYTLFADRGDGTYSQFDETHAHMNMPATFVWGRGLGDRPIRITFHPPAGSGWKAATQLEPTTDPMTFAAPNFQYFMDSPTELSDLTMRSWEVQSNGKTYTIRLAVHHDGTEDEVDSYESMVRKVVNEQIAVFGETPDYDYGTYTFIADYLPWVSGDGMEHRNSTIMASRSSLSQRALGLLGTVSHEYFHGWNVERIRPRSLEPFDFEHANMSGELWFAEGFTSYYTSLFIRRAGLIDDAEYARRLSGGLSFVINSPGRRFFSPVEMSMQAAFVDAATAIDPTNRANTFISYYTWGSAVGLNLDLTLRARYDRTLDDFMRDVWQKYGKTEIPYTVDDLERTLGEFTGDREFARTFFERYIKGKEVGPYETLLARAGFLLRPASPDRPYLGIAGGLSYDEDGATLRQSPTIGGPLYELRVARGDRIVSMDGNPIRSRTDILSVLDAHRPGDTIEIEFWQRGRIRSERLTWGQNPSLEVVTYEQAGMTVTEEMREFRQAWLEGRR